VRVAKYVSTRLAILIPQVFAVVTVTFFVIRILPGDPSVRQAVDAGFRKENLICLRPPVSFDNTPPFCPE